ALRGVEGGPFVAAALAVLEEGQRVRGEGRPEVVIGDRPEAGAMVGIVVPPAAPALIGQTDRALAARGGRWRFATAGTPGPIAGLVLPTIAGLQVTRRYRIETVTGDAGRGTSADTTVLATVNGEPWLVRDGAVLLLGSRLDTAWTALPAAPAFVPFLDALVNRVARGEAPISEAEGAPGAGGAGRRDAHPLMPLDFVIDRLDALPATRALAEGLPASGARQGIAGLPGSSPAVLVAALARRLPQRVFVVVTPTPTDAE